jgi:hypothetical protein
MKKTLKSVVMIGTFCSGMLQASWEFRTPLSAQWRGYFHWQLSSVADSWWYETMPSLKDRTMWDFHFWGVGYSRTASTAFFNPRENHNTRHQASLSSLFFGKEVFRGEDVFTNGTFSNATIENIALVNNANPFLLFARIMPNFDYNENGAFMGLEVSRNFGCNDKLHVGVRASIPYKVIEIEQDSDAILEETLSDVVITRPVSINEGATGNEIEYAYRFDFLNSLVFTSITTPSNLVATRPVVVYPANNQTLTIAGANVMGDTAADPGIAAYATVRADGTVPPAPFRKLPTEVSGPVGPNGGGGLNNDTLFFETGFNYGLNLANNRDAQGQLFIVPRAVVETGNIGSTITQDAEDIYTAINNLINTEFLVSQTASQFFLDKGIDFAGYSRNVGIGDLATEVYVGYGYKDNWFFDGIFGLQFPTGKRQKSSNDVYFKPTGNNGHVEIKLGIDTGWMVCPWFAFEFDLAYHHACKRAEKRAASFEGATIVNIGPELTANVSWNYFVGRIDLNFFHPHNPDLGFTFGYELFAKGHDKVEFAHDQRTVTDLLGRPNQPLDAENYERRTNALSNKLRAQIFNRWNYFELFAGGSQVVAGRDVMRETEAHIGLVVYF